MAWLVAAVLIAAGGTTAALVALNGNSTPFLQLGQCLTGTASSPTVVSCSQSHKAKVFYAASFWSRGEGYPGSAILRSQAKAACLRKSFATFGRGTYVYFYYIYPAQNSWDGGSRRLVCVATGKAAQ